MMISTYCGINLKLIMTVKRREAGRGGGPGGPRGEGAQKGLIVCEYSFFFYIKYLLKKKKNEITDFFP